MKKIGHFPCALSFLLLLCSFQMENQQPLLKSLKMNDLSVDIKEDTFGSYIELDLWTNHKLTETKRIKLNQSSNSNTLNTTNLEVTKLSVKSAKSLLIFEYKGYKFKIRFKKKEGIWVINTVFVKGNGTFQYTFGEDNEF